MYSLDKSGYKQRMLDFYTQIKESHDIYSSARLSIDGKNIHNILYLGVGGSALVGNLLYDILFDDLHVPMDIVRSYFAPAYCTRNTLVIASSYSGDSEETISAALAASEMGANVLTLSAGGQLSKLADDNGWDKMTVPEGYQPRQALGFLFFPLYHLFGDLGLIENYQADLSDLCRFIREAAQRNNYPKVDGPVLSRELANTICNSIPVIYSTSPYLKSVSVSWQNQIQQNAKSPAFANVLPEMNHNEIVGWEFNHRELKHFIAVFLENEDVHPRIKRRIELSKQIIKKCGVEVVDIYARGETTMEKVFSLLILGDWVSYYLALAYKKDPTEINHIDFLKKEMSKLDV